MAILGIRTAWGPQATKDKRKYKLDKLKLKNEVKLGQQFTDQIVEGDAAVAAALMGIGVATPEPAGFLGLDWSNQNTQIAAGVAALGGAYLGKRWGWF